LRQDFKLLTDDKEASGRKRCDDPTCRLTLTDPNHPYSREIRLFKNASKLFSSTTLAAAIGVVSFILTARYLGAEGYGALALVIGFTTAVLRLCEFQAWQALITQAAHYKTLNHNAKVASLFKLGVIVDFASCGVAFLIALGTVGIAAELFTWRVEVLEAAEIYLFVLLVSARGTPTAVLRFYDRFGRIAAHQIVSAIIKLLAVLFVIANELSFSHLIFAWMFSHIADYVILQTMAFRVFLTELGEAPSQAGTGIRAVATPALFRFLVTSNLDSSLRMVRELDVQFVVLFVDENAAGILRVARQLSAFAGRLLDAFYSAIYPDLAKLAAQKEWSNLRVFVARSAFSVGLLAFLGMGTFAVIGNWLLAVIFGGEFTAAYGITCILLLSMVVWGFVQPFAPALLATGSPGPVLFAHSIAAAFYLIMLIVLVPGQGILGAGWAMLSLYTIWGGLVLLAYQRIVPRK
jgi:O-antigen/teichoic acid export membrane protein